MSLHFPCMNMGGSSGEDGAIRVALPGSGSRGAYTLSKENAKTYKGMIFRTTRHRHIL